MALYQRARRLYTEREPFTRGYLKAGLHRVYYEQSGNRNGVPILFLHGGPGSGCNEDHRRYFHPMHFRAVLFDQRGSNRSSPAGELRDNTTRDLLQDIERIRTELNIPAWMLFGGSWGATLALLYAQKFPQRVTGIVLRGAFLARQEDLEWFVGPELRARFPKQWDRFRDFVGCDDMRQALERLYEALTGSDQGAQEQAAWAWAQWAGTVVTHTKEQQEEYVVDESSLAELVPSTRIEIHYALHRYFLEENQILREIDKVPPVPVHLLHGQDDLTCLPQSSELLHEALPGSRLTLVPNVGHLANDMRMQDNLIRATEKMMKNRI